MQGSLLKIKSFDEISASESIKTIFHPLELTSATHFMIDHNPREDEDDTIKRKSSSDAISQMSEVSRMSDIIEKDSIKVEGLDNRRDSPLEDATATERTVYNSCSTKESTQFTNNVPLVCSDYIQDRTIQSQFPVLSDEFVETESFHDSTDTIHLQTIVDSSVAIGSSPQHSPSTDECVSCHDRESKQHASYNLTTVDVNSNYIGRFTQWKVPLNSTTSSSGYITDDSGYLQSSSVTNYSDTDEMSQPMNCMYMLGKDFTDDSGYLQSSSVTNYSDTNEMSQPMNSMYMLGKDFDHSSNIALDLNDDFYLEANEMEFEISCSDGHIQNN